MPALSAHAPLLREFAKRYLGASAVDLADTNPDKVVAAVMNSGIANDTVRLTTAVGPDILKTVLQQARPGIFTALAWRHWHLKLGLAQADRIPSLPT